MLKKTNRNLLKNKIMGQIFSYFSEEDTQQKPQEPEPVQVNQEDMTVFKMKIQKDIFFNKIKNTEKVVGELNKSIITLIKQGDTQKQKAKHNISKKKSLEIALLEMMNKFSFLNKNINTQESAIETANFSDLVKESNCLLSDLNQKNKDVEDIIKGKELCENSKQISSAVNKEVKNFQNDDDQNESVDDEIEAMYEKIAREMVPNHKNETKPENEVIAERNTPKRAVLLTN